ncbi:sigma-54-dependent transcriptional regulator [Pseudoalteromonas fenneropenaei]|uniref:Sigma-54-dependent transcriptional regulator n=1 Tax=Pseudoalteromonas fenneropenaei TaxID=1737459 RepID=A0ABV7CL95_9GAMM
MTILVVDDNPEVRLSASYLLEDHGFTVLEADSIANAKALLPRAEISLILLDMNFSRDTTSGAEGLQFLRWLRNQSQPPAVICLTGWGCIDLAVQAMQLGAADFIEKPWQNERLLCAIWQQSKVAQRLPRHAPSSSTHEYQWRSPVMKTLLQQLQRVSHSDAAVFLSGPSGSGKTQLASWLHRQSERRDGPFVAVNMGAIAAELFESEMYGHVKGAFTDAKSARVGRFAAAHQGTLFLDEIATLPLPQQIKLLRVLESGEYERVGSSATERANVRVVSATNADMNAQVSSGAFREDLYYRLNTLIFEVPPLAARRDDIIPLAQFLIASLCDKYTFAHKTLSDCAAQALLQYPWPGNVRELKHVLERAVLLSDSALIKAADCQLRLAKVKQLAADETPKQSLANVERELILRVYRECRGQVADAAVRLGLTKSSLYRRLDKYGIRDESAL